MHEHCCFLFLDFIPEDDDIIIQQVSIAMFLVIVQQLPKSCTLQENAEIQICQKSLKTVTLRADSAENTDMFGTNIEYNKKINRDDHICRSDFGSGMGRKHRDRPAECAGGGSERRGRGRGGGAKEWR